MGVDFNDTVFVIAQPSCNTAMLGTSLAKYPTDQSDTERGGKCDQQPRCANATVRS
jgi:hypothetical protein